MFSLNASIKYYLYPYPADLRKGFYTLSGIVKCLTSLDACAGDAFIFINRTLDGMKILHAENGGLVIYHIHLKIGRFRMPPMDMGNNKAVVMTT